jgi:hypothetical protein
MCNYNVTSDWGLWTNDQTDHMLSSNTVNPAVGYVACMAQCVNHASCNAWTWQQQTYTSGICRLYDTWTSAGTRTDGVCVGNAAICKWTTGFCSASASR